MSHRVLLAGLFHETHTFLNDVTRLEDFRVWRGEALLEAEGDTSTLSGALEVAKDKGWTVLPVIDITATPGPMVEDSVVETFWTALREVAERETAEGVDGIYLALHGAMVSQSWPDVEGEILGRLRSLPALADVPLCGVLDLHANVTPVMAQHSQGLVAYRENPHTDARDAAMRGARLLDRLMCSGEQARTLYAHPPIVWPPSGTGTANEPMRTLEARAREWEARCPELLAVNVFGGFAFADLPETGVSFTLTTVGEDATAQECLQDLCDCAWQMRTQGCPSRLSLQEALQRVKQQDHGPILLVEPADNIGGGAPGDNTTILRALLEHGIENAAVCLNDPEAVQTLWSHPIGERIQLAVGGKSGAIGAEPLMLELVPVSRSDGRFLLEDRNSHAAATGALQEMGPCVVAWCEGVTLLLTSRKTPPFDLGQWHSQGIVPEDKFVIGVKAAVAHRRAYDPITRASYTVETVGPCTENLTLLPYRHIARPIYPLDT